MTQIGSSADHGALSPGKRPANPKGDGLAAPGEVHCALGLALAEVGDRWSFMILRAAFSGVEHFDLFQKELAIARNVLANRLVRLVAHGIILREVVATDRRRVRYRLTQKGRELEEVMVALRLWGQKWGAHPPDDHEAAQRGDASEVSAQN